MDWFFISDRPIVVQVLVERELKDMMIQAVDLKCLMHGNAGYVGFIKFGLANCKALTTSSLCCSWHSNAVITVAPENKN